MRLILAVFLIMPFLAGNFENIASAATIDHACTHQQTDNHNGEDVQLCHLEQDEKHDQNACSDCCCAHSHAIAIFSTLLKMPMNVSQQLVIASADSHYSFEYSALRRPPRL